MRSPVGEEFGCVLTTQVTDFSMANKIHVGFPFIPPINLADEVITGYLLAISETHAIPCGGGIWLCTYHASHCFSMPNKIHVGRHDLRSELLQSTYYQSLRHMPSHVGRIWLCTYHASYCFSMANKIHVGFPSISLNDLSSGATVVHSMSGHYVMSIR